MTPYKQDKKLCVYYDGSCYICASEISYYMRKDTERNIAFVDISAPNFDPKEYGLENRDIHINLHVQFANGDIVTGVDAFRAIWNHIPGFKILAKISQNCLINKMAKVGYYLFTKVRPYLPRKKDTCKSGTCSMLNN